MSTARAGALLAAILALGGCATPSYVNRGKGETASEIWPNQVVFTLHDAFRDSPPRCVALLPLDGSPPEAASAVRRVLFAHLAPQGRRQVPLARIDHVLAAMPEAERKDRTKLGAALNCDSVLAGEITQAGSDFFGLYSRVAVGVRLRLTRAADGEILWEGEHVASSHGGSVPLSPIGVAMGILDAATNLTEEQRLRVTDDLARRLASTIPDQALAELDDPVAEPPKLAQTAPPASADVLAQAEALAAQGDYAGALAAAEKLAGENPGRADVQFLKGRMLVKLDRVPEAEPAMIRAVALDGGNARYLDGLGHVNALAGRTDRALAAYAMAIDADHADGFAWYNSAVLLLGNGQGRPAADAFYGAALAYLKRGDAGMAGRALADLKSLGGRGLDLGREIHTIETALGASSGEKPS
ncbi:tetratricopeptide repeat protein [Magnetospirillum sp. ME-1]|uniref:tetratricopeptide repeat protein n=1 Tax=Magnetospirillum sp. ME-1 TaxID=1639348 RepID=UPI000A19636E|nr:tetratricopeptide repeat protein [Magnetospirillum sp. ME-1]